MPSPNAGRLLSVSAASSTSAWAVGLSWVGSGHSVIEHWNGAQWLLDTSQGTTNQNSALYGVTAISLNEAWVVGYTGSIDVPFYYGAHPLIEHYLNGAWSVISNPSINGSLWSITAISSNNVWAVGYNHDTDNELIERWDGFSWSIIPSPLRTTSGALLHSITAISATNIWAVGTSNWLGRQGQAIADHWNGVTWVMQDPPAQTDGNGSLFTSVSAVPVTGTVWAVGNTFGNSSNYQDTAIKAYYANGLWTVASDSQSRSYRFTAVVATASEVDVIADMATERLVNGIWQIVPVEIPPHGGSLWSITSVPGSTSFWAVGETYGGELIEQYSPSPISPPTVTNASFTGMEGQTGAGIVQVHSASRTLLTASGLPPFVSFKDNSNNTGTVTFTPKGGNAGNYIFTVTANDGMHTGKGTVTLQVSSG